MTPANMDRGESQWLGKRRKMEVKAQEGRVYIGLQGLQRVIRNQKETCKAYAIDCDYYSCKLQTVHAEERRLFVCAFLATSPQAYRDDIADPELLVSCEEFL